MSHVQCVPQNVTIFQNQSNHEPYCCTMLNIGRVFASMIQDTLQHVTQRLAMGNIDVSLDNGGMVAVNRQHITLEHIVKVLTFHVILSTSLRTLILY